jgi:hypothetical protein
MGESLEVGNVGGAGIQFSLVRMYVRKTLKKKTLRME